MKKTSFFTLLLFLFFYSCNNSTQSPENNKLQNKQKDNYQISGYVVSKDNKEVILSDSIGNVINKATIINNSFSFVGNPDVKIAFLHFPKGIKEPVFLDTLIYNARIWDNNPNRFLIYSSQPEQVEYNTYQKELANIDRQLFLLSNHVSRTRSFDTEEIKDQYVALIDRRNNLSSDFIKKNAKKYISLFDLERSSRYLEENEIKLLFSSIDTALQKTPLGIKLATRINKFLEFQKNADSNIAKITPQTDTIIKFTPKSKKPERHPAPQFSGLSPEGYLIDLQYVVKKNKIVMLDFWGTWCQPCRMQNSFWNRLYKKYHDKGFEIISIAEETEESRPYLENAIGQDDMKWQHIVDENYKIAELYRAFSLPHAVLIDKEGNVIYYKATARDIQEFLQKYFSE